MGKRNKVITIEPTGQAVYSIPKKLHYEADVVRRLVEMQCMYFVGGPHVREILGSSSSVVKIADGMGW